MKSCETSSKEIILRKYRSSIVKLEKYHFSIVQARLSQILKISISTFKWYIFKIHCFCIESVIPRSRIVSYHIFLSKCHHSTISPNNDTYQKVAGGTFKLRESVNYTKCWLLSLKSTCTCIPGPSWPWPFPPAVLPSGDKCYKLLSSSSKKNKLERL